MPRNRVRLEIERQQPFAGGTAFGEGGRPLRGRVRQEFSTIAPGIVSLGVSAGAEGGENVQPYPVVDRSTATLTIREHEADPRVAVVESDWEISESGLDLHIKDGFKPGWIYELARARNPLDPAVPLGPLIPVLTAPGGS